MSIVNEYLEKASRALRSNNATEIDSIAREIVSAFSSEIPHLSSYRGGRIPSSLEGSMHTESDLKKLIGKLKVLRDEKDRELYGPYGFDTITSNIRRLEGALLKGSSEEETASLYREIDNTYANEYPSYVCGLAGWGYLEFKVSEEQTKSRINKLKHYRDSELQQFNKARYGGGNTTFTQTITNSAYSESSVSISVGDIFDRIDGLSDNVLSDEDKVYLKGLISDLEVTVKKNPESAKEKAARAIKWLGDKGVDAIIAASPYLLQTIQSLF